MGAGVRVWVGPRLWVFLRPEGDDAVCGAAFADVAFGIQHWSGTMYLPSKLSKATVSSESHFYREKILSKQEYVVPF